MKKAVLIILAVLVTLGIGLLLYMQITRTTPVYAGSENQVVTEGMSLAVSGKYYTGLEKAEVDTALLDVADGIEGARTAYDAILAKGTPVFTPSFFINIVENGADYIRLSGEILDVPLENQKSEGFYCENLTMNVYTDGASRVISLRNSMPQEVALRTVSLPVITDDGLVATTRFDAEALYDMNIALVSGNTSSVVTFEWTYNVKNAALFNLSEIDEQIITADVCVTVDNGVAAIAFE